LVRPRITVSASYGSLTATRDVDVSLSSPQQAVLVAGQTFPAALASPGLVSSARVETYTPRYSYLLTVRRHPDGSADIACPIFFNRRTSTVDERVYGAEIYVDSNDGQSKIDVQWLSTPDPLIAEGNYVFDAINGYWYRMINVSLTSSTTATVVIDRTPQAYTDTPYYALANPGTQSMTDYDGGVMFLPGIIRVFNIKLQ
jgi:hypothetical protein